MTGLAVALFAFTPQQPAATMLPRPHAWQAGFALSDVSAISMTYPIDQPGIDILSQVAVDIEVRYLDGDVWRCPPQGRFSLVDADRNPAGETQFPSRTFTGKSWSWLLGMVRQAKLGGLNDRGEREFKNTTVAQAIGTLIDEAHAYGGVP